MQLILSLFSGVGLLDRAFREKGFCVVSAGDLITGQDIRDFHVIAGLDLYYQAKRTTLKLNNIIEYLSCEKEELDNYLYRFENINGLNKNIKKL